MRLLKHYLNIRHRSIPRIPANSTFALLGALGVGGATLSFLATRVELKEAATKPHDSSNDSKSLKRFSADVSVDVDKILRQHEETHQAPLGSGIWRYDTAQYAINDPIQDDHAQAIVPFASGHWSFFSVMDGYDGWETSAWLRENLIPAVVGALADLYSRFVTPIGDPYERSSVDPKDINRTVKETFMRLDKHIVYDGLEKVFAAKSKHAAVNILAPALSGSSALLAFYDTHTQDLQIAQTGVTRAVLGRRSTTHASDGTYTSMILSPLHNANNASEKRRLTAAHPEEPVIADGRLFGTGRTRAFGNAVFKWGEDIQARLKEFHLVRTLREPMKTPPWLTAEPFIATHKIRPGDFLILGSEGLWQSLCPTEVVGLVGLWLNERKGMHGNDPDRPRARIIDITSIAPGDLPVKSKKSIELLGSGGRYTMWGAKKTFTLVDDNVATHILRNAVGGADSDLTAALLSMELPRSKVYNNDITVTVVFFD